MEKPKLALEYFVRLVELHGLVSKRNFFHDLYSGRLDFEPGRHFVRAYDADSEEAVYEWTLLGFSDGRVRVNFRQQLCAEVAEKTLEVKAFILERLSTSAESGQDVFYRHVMTDIERLTRIVAKEQVFARYPCIDAALLDIKAFALTYAPQQPESGRVVNAPTPVEEQVVSYQYKYFAAGSRTEDKSLTSHYLGELFYKLRNDLKLIASDTSVEDFRAIFSGKVVLKPIMWIGTNKQLRHFFRVIEHKLIPLENKKTGKWDVVAACFIHRNGESFTAGQLQSTGATGKNIPRIDEIEELGSVLR